MGKIRRIGELIAEIHKIDTDNTITEKDEFIVELIKEFVTENEVASDNRLNVFMEALKKDNNLVRAMVINGLIDDGVISRGDLLKIGIRQAFIDALEMNGTRQYSDPNGPLYKIKNLSTEVYFWGIPASGKTCAIGAMLSMAAKSDLPQINVFNNGGDCQGKKYMNELTRMFPYDISDEVRDDVSDVMPLPNGTHVENTYEMFFELIDNRNKVLPITFIDMAGELIRCMYKKNMGIKLSSEEEKALQTVTNVLKDNRTENQKIHVFVVEYGGENREYEGVSQTDYLMEAITYLENKIKCEDGSTFNVFKDKTDGIYLMVTQVDKAGVQDDMLKEHVRKYMEGRNNYNSIANKLKYICQMNHINGGKLAVMLFSLGEVCFKDYCLFSPRFTSKALQTLLSHVYRYDKRLKTPWINWIYKFLGS